MDTRLVLVSDERTKDHGTVKTVALVNGNLYHGLSVGTWRLSDTDGYIYLTLYHDLDTIIHETATTKAVRAELRAAEKDAKGVEKKPIIILDPVTKRFKEVYP